MHSHGVGLFLMVAGLVLIGLGLVVWTGALRWFGSLPGDIRMTRGPVRVYAPIVSMILLSLALTLVLRLFRR